MDSINKNLNANLRNDFLRNLSLNEQRVYTYFMNKIGYTAVPRSVPLLYCGKKLGLSRQQMRTIIKKLKGKGLLDTWTTKHPTQFKITYYRLPQPQRLFNVSTTPSSVGSSGRTTDINQPMYKKLTII